MIVEYTERAKRHVLETFDWILDRSDQAAEKWLESLEETVSQLKTDPARFRFAPENDTHDIEIRQFLHGKRRGQFRVLFTIERDRVIILDVRHSSRLSADPGSLHME